MKRLWWVLILVLVLFVLVFWLVYKNGAGINKKVVNQPQINEENLVCDTFMDGDKNLDCSVNMDFESGKKGMIVKVVDMKTDEGKVFLSVKRVDGDLKKVVNDKIYLWFVGGKDGFLSVQHKKDKDLFCEVSMEDIKIKLEEFDNFFNLKLKNKDIYVYGGRTDDGFIKPVRIKIYDP